MSVYAVSLVWLVACEPGEGRTDGPERPEPTDEPTEELPTGQTPTGPEGLTASCALEPENVLRARCTVRVAVPGPVRVELTTPEGQTRSFPSEAEAGEHEIVLYGMTPSSPYAWRAVAGESSVTGTLQTGSLPAALSFTLTTVGTPTFPLLLLPDACGATSTAIIVRTRDGRPVWYEDLGRDMPYAGTLDQVGWTGDGTVLGLTTGGAIVESTMTGERPLLLRKTVDFEDEVHHDVWRRDGKTYVLFREAVANSVAEWTIDGFLVFDAEGEELWRWRMADHLALPEEDVGDDADYTHSNSIWTDSAGDVYLSLRHLNAAMKIEGDPADPAYGEILWTLVGSPLGVQTGLVSDFVLSSSTPQTGEQVDFQQQHNLHLLPNGRLALFDNRIAVHEQSRVLQIELDEAAGTADIAAAWPLPEFCEFQGGAWHTPAGNPVATCGPSSTIYEFDEASGAASGAVQPRWRAEVWCGGQPGSAPIPRAVPLEEI